VRAVLLKAADTRLGVIDRSASALTDRRTQVRVAPRI
jgi:hypothetical protein